MRRRRVVAIGALAAALTLTGCAPDLPANTRWQPAPVTAALASVDPAIEIPWLDVADLPTTGYRITNSDAGIDVAWSEFAGAGVEAHIREQVHGFIDAQEEASGVDYVPRALRPGEVIGERGCWAKASAQPVEEFLAASEITRTGPGTVAGCDVIAATEDWYGVRWRFVTLDESGTVVTDAVFTEYYERDTGASATIDALLTLDEESLSALWREVAGPLRLAAGALWPGQGTTFSAEQREQFEAALAGAVLTADGALLVQSQEGIEVPDLESSPVSAVHGGVRFSPEAIEPFLTERGHALIAALQEAAPAATGSRKPEADCSLVPCVALTYDDGPDPDQGVLLDILAERDVYATFFFLGMLVESNADQVLRTHEDGHEIANHSWNHPYFTSLSSGQLSSQLSRTQSVLESVTGEAPTLVRPPYGALNGPTIAAIDMPLIMWDVDTLDWQSPPVASLIDTAVNSSEAGSIVLMHSIHPGTVEAAGPIIDGLHERGFELVTVTGLFDGEVPSGVVGSAR